MNFDILTDHYIPIVIIACLIIGYCIKHITWLDKVSNQYIPTILAVLGAIFGCVVNGVSFQNVVAGALSGLISTGLYEAFRNVVEKPSK